MSWRFIASRLNGNGTETFLDYNIPLSGAEITRDLSGPGVISGTITPEIAAMVGPDGEPLLQPWSTAIYAEEDGVIRDGAILEALTEEGPDLILDAVGFTAYAKDTPYTSTYSVHTRDPLQIVRDIWNHIEGHKGGNLGVSVSLATSPIRLGTPEDPRLTAAKNAERDAQKEYDERKAVYEDAKRAYDKDKTDAKKKARDDAKKALDAAKKVLDKAKDTRSKFKDGEAKHYTLNWWETFDLGGEIDDLAANTPFDYVMDHAWRPDGTVSHFLRLGYPTLGRRRHDLRFMVGENVYTLPSVERDGDEYADTVVVLGAGEGRKMVRATASKAAGRLRRVKVHEDKSVKTTAKAERLAASLLRLYGGEETITTVEVLDHPNAAIGTYDVGDEILVQHPTGWTDDLAVWSRILSIRFSPETGLSTLELARA
ncbi:minor tail protein [Arthrobacter phage Emotion]|uniref:Minor tail protein n=1 Tax=Arthrobacter phage Emotion TaxID=3038361 RepID=A0AA49ERW8_9CAUD|nr:minor tail protein [Arthrobacter phage Emotion]